MDTLRRVGSIRKSIRKQQKPLLTDPENEIQPVVEGEAEPQSSYFTLTCTDVFVTAASSSFQPTHLRISISRHRKQYASNTVLWEPSLKTPLSGTGVWHPPFVVTLSISPPLRSKSKGTLRHKDAFVSLENVDLKGHKKLLAKARVNLSDYYTAASVSAVAFRLKLFPESSKISAASLSVAIQRTEAVPQTASSPLPQTDVVSDGAILLTPPQKISPVSSTYDVSETEEGYIESMPRPASIFLGDLSSDQKENNNEQAKKTSRVSLVESEKPSVVPATTLVSPIKPVEPEDQPAGDVLAVEEIRLPMAEQEDFDIEPQPVIISGVLLPTGPPPPLPRRDRTPEVSVNAENKKDVKPVVNPDVNDTSDSTKIPEIVIKPSEVKLEVVVTPDEPTFKVPITPSRKVSEPTEPESPPPNISLGFVCASPKVTPHKQSSEEQDLLKWAKKSLSGYRQIKITNLASSWRNGLGFCALLYDKYPNLVPLNSLKMHNLRDNVELALEVADLIGVSTTIGVDDLTENKVPDKTAVMAFLRELRFVLNDPEQPAEVPAERVVDFQKKWFEKCGYFSDEVAHLFAVDAELAEDEPHVDATSEETTEGQPEIDQPQSPQDDKRPGRERVRELIAAAHKEDAAAAHEVEDVDIGRGLIESKTISEEMSKLLLEEERISREKDKLERILRDETTTKKAMEHGMQRWMQLVNEKNSLVRRQMQLNIAEQERAIARELETIQWKLQKYTDMDEDQKTEVIRQEEQALLDQLLAAVNKKNELVLHLDTQEQAIAEDERIQKLVESNDLMSLKKEEECVIQ